MALPKDVINELKTSVEILNEQIEVSKVVLQKKGMPATQENVLKAAQVLATNRLATATTNEKPKKTTK